MRPALMNLLGLASLLAACSNPAVVDNGRVPREAIAQDATQRGAPYQAFIDDLCGRWATINRADRQQYRAFYQRARSAGSTPTDGVRWSMDILADVSLVKCWWTAAEVIGFAGDDRAASALLTHLDGLRPGRWTLLNGQEASRVTHFEALARGGLAISAARRGDAHPVSHRILEHLKACTTREYWAQADRVPHIEPSWYPGEDAEEIQDALRFEGRLRCVEALGNSGLVGAAQYLEAWHAKALDDPRWSRQARDGQIMRIINAARRARLIGKLGVERYVHQHGAFF